MISNAIYFSSTPGARCSGGECPKKYSCAHAVEVDIHDWSDNKIYPVPASSYCGYYVQSKYRIPIKVKFAVEGYERVVWVDIDPDKPRNFKDMILQAEMRSPMVGINPRGRSVIAVFDDERNCWVALSTYEDHLKVLKGLKYLQLCDYEV